VGVLFYAAGACGPTRPFAGPNGEGDASVAAVDTPADPPTPPTPKTLYDRLGGRDGVRQLIDSFVGKLYEERRLTRLFAKLKKDADRDAQFRALLAEQLCAETGGGCAYSGLDMKIAHKGLRIANAEWNLFIEKLTQVLVERKVEEDDQSEIFSLLGKMQKDVLLK
jgi:hemoglobin